MLKYFFVISLISSIFLSCGSEKKNINIEDAFVSLVTNHEKVVGYGYVDVASIVQKGDLASIPSVGEMVESNFSKLSNAIQTDGKIFYAMTGPLDRDGMPSNVISIAKVKNKDSVRRVFTEMGYDFEKENERLVHFDMSTAIGIDDDFIVVVTADFQGDPKKEMMVAYEKMIAKDRDDRINEVISEETDILIATHLQNLYGTSSTSLNELPEAQKKEIQAMVENSHISTSVTFNNGDLTIHANTSRVSDAMKEAYFFKSKGAEKVAQSIGPGKPVVAMAAAMDLAKMEKFMNRFSPNAAKEFYRGLGVGGFFMQAMGSDGISTLVNGNIGFNLTGLSKDVVIYGGIPAFNGYVGFGKNGENLKDLIHSFSEDGQVEELGDGYYKMQQAIGLVSKEELVFHSNDSVKERFNVQPITRVEGMNDFGVEPVSFYVDMEQISNMEMTNSPQAEALLALAKHMTLSANPEGITMKLVMKNQNENVLKQIVTAAAEQFKSQISGMSF